MKSQRPHLLASATPRSAQPDRRRAMIIMSVLVSISVVMALFVAWTRTLVVEQRTVEAQLPEFKPNIWRARPWNEREPRRP